MNRLVFAITDFSGCSVNGIMSSYHLSQAYVMKSVWFFVNAVQQLEQFKIKYPSDHIIQQAIESRKSLLVVFCLKLWFDDWLLIWI